jgi:hypothetical protein
MAVSPSLKTPLTGSGLRRYLPFLNWLVHYRRADLPGDLVAGLVTAIMLIPQSIASSRDIFGCSKNRQNRIVENSTYPLDDFGFR